MNERIKELARQCTYEYSIGIDSPVAGFDKEKFAELIVAECIETLRLVPYNSDREFGDEILYQDAVKQHFGVEE